MFFVFLYPNKIEQAIILLGVSDKPEVFIENWTEKRPQYKILESGENSVEILRTSHKIESEEKYEFMKRDKSKFYEQYSLLWSIIKNSPEIYQPLDQNNYLSLL